MNPKNSGALCIVASATGFATLGIFIKFAFVAGANITTILAFRFLLAALFIVPVLKFKGVSLRVSRRNALHLSLMGAVGYGGMSMLYANSIRNLPASLTGMLLYTYPALVSILSFAIGDERYSRQKGIALVLCCIGLVLILGGALSAIKLPGIYSALGAAVIYAFYIIIGNRLLKNTDPLVTTFYVCLAAGLTFLLYGLATGNMMFHLPLPGWLAILGIAFFSTLMGVLGFFAGLRLIGATNASILSTLEPLLTVFLSFLLLGEKITLVQAGGGFVLLIGVIVLQLWGREGGVAEDAGEVVTVDM